VNKTLNTLSLCAAAVLVAACGGGDDGQSASREASRLDAATAQPRVAAAAADAPAQVRGPGRDLEPFQWTKVYDGAWPPAPPPPVVATTGWAGRAGLQAVELRNRLYIMGGRTPAPFGPPTFGPFNSRLWNDVWESRDVGASWTRLPTPGAPNMWAERAYFQAVTKGGAMFVLGGQDFAVRPNVPPVCPPPPAPCPAFVPDSSFFDDVWRSTDGVNWQALESDGPRWAGRAGHSAIVFKGWIYVLGGGSGDDVAIGGSGRVLYNDVWRSRDGKHWESVTAQAAWAPRAGAALVAKNGYLYLLGGEDGFLCEFGPTGPSCPYFNDVWRSNDGAHWELVTMSAGWSARPGHQCQVLFDTIVCFGGFGFPSDPSGTVAAHPVDVWVSRDGARWAKLQTGPWNATSPAQVKYDFDSLVVSGGPGGSPPSIYTFGGDREASFIAPDPALVDDEVWRFSQPWLKP
jgi:hypothetical protein